MSTVQHLSPDAVINSFMVGHWLGGDGDPFASYNPSTHGLIRSGHFATIEQAREAVLHLRSNQPQWEATSIESRRAILTRFTELIYANEPQLTQLVADEVGKPLWEAATEVNAVRAKLAPTLDFNERRASTLVSNLSGMRSVTRFRPLGVVSVISPFNFPLSMLNTHVMPALLAGNSVVIKPSEHAPVLATRYVELLLEAGVPSNVVALLHGGPEIARELARLSDGLYLTGSRAAGESILSSIHDRTDVLLALEMGGNSPLVIWDYDDLDVPVWGAIQSGYISAGQRCSAARRIILPAEDTHFVPRLAEVTASLLVDVPLAATQPFVGPLISPQAVTALERRYNELLRLGAKEIVPLTVVNREANLVRPSILDVSGISMSDEEHFGPLLLIQRVQSIEKAIEVANETRYGLAAGIYCRTREVYERFRNGTRAGIVNWNQALTGAVGVAPFGGVKDSGNYRPGGSLSVDYCVYAVASLEVEEPTLPAILPPGVRLGGQ